MQNKFNSVKYVQNDVPPFSFFLFFLCPNVAKYFQNFQNLAKAFSETGNTQHELNLFFCNCVKICTKNNIPIHELERIVYKNVLGAGLHRDSWCGQKESRHLT